MRRDTCFQGNCGTRLRGAALIEAMISVVIMGSSIAALAGLHINMSRSAESARQQTEAILLAREKMEQLRGTPGITTLPGVQGPESGEIASNTSYEIQWWIGTSTQPAGRPATVQVLWTDRRDAKHQITLDTFLSEMDPADSGAIYFAGDTPENAVEARSVTSNIALNGFSLPSGETALRLGEPDQYLLIDATTGLTSKICRTAPSGTVPGTGQIQRQLAVAASEGKCAVFLAWVISGFISRDPSLSDSDWNAIQSEIGVNSRLIQRTPTQTSSIQCLTSNLRDERSGVVANGIKTYLCIIPFALPDTAQGKSGGVSWSGKWLISGPAGWQLPGQKIFVCRYEYLPGIQHPDANHRNVQPYVSVSQPLYQQNYRIAATLDTTGKTSPNCPENMNTFSADANALTVGVLHQDCRSASNPSAFSSACPVTRSP